MPDTVRALDIDIDRARITAILDAAHADGRTTLFEHEVYGVLETAGASVPRWVFVAAGDDPADHARDLPPGETLVMKIVAPGLTHKSDIGGVALVGRDPANLSAAMGKMLARAAAHGVSNPKGVLLVERATLASGGVSGASGAATGAEVLFALRQTREFGPVLTMGMGGLDTELMAASLRPGLGAVTASATLLDAPALLNVFRRTLAYARLAGRTRSAAGTPLVADDTILRTLGALRALAQPGAAGPWEIAGLEVNPFGATSAGDLVALDGLASFGSAAAPTAERPLASIDALLTPRSIAVIGVSAKIRNLGRIILGNILDAGFDRNRTWIVRPGIAEIDGVACVPRIADLPERVDVFVIAVGAEQVPAVMDEIVDADKATGVIVIPGGMAEKGGGEVFEGGLGVAVARARGRRLPLVVNGGNCLGIVSRPGRYDTLFIPPEKLPKPSEAARADVALVSQSGGFMITRLSKLPWLAPRYAISTGNQVDLTVGDFVRRIADDPEIRTIAVYIEGFRDGDGLAFARAVDAFTSAGGGRDVIFYKAGRTAEGRASAIGHTASISGDYDVCASLVREAGAHVADSFDDFQALLKISVLMGARDWRGNRLGAVSNAGFEAVAIADRLRGEGWALEAAALSDSTVAALSAALTEGRADTLVDVRNPLDLTPMAGDAVHEAVVRALAADPSVDAVLWSTVPLTDACATLPAEFAAAGDEGMPARLAAVAASTTRPLIASVDAGPLFDPFAAAIEARGIPVFRSVDAALRALGLYAAVRVGRKPW